MNKEGLALLTSILFMNNLSPLVPLDFSVQVENREYPGEHMSQGPIPTLPQIGEATGIFLPR